MIRWSLALMVLLLTCTGSGWAQPELIPASQIESIREQKDPFVLDVRSLDEIRKLGTVPNYYHIPVDELENRLDELPKDRDILIL
jgi:rhodanese-related sulfurtransferase